jgi:SAM-dependent methyltransferase
VPDDAGWNHNTHYHPLALRHASRARSAVDVGCGEGLLTRRLAAAGAPRVVGVDADPEQIRRARRAAGDATVSYVLGDALEEPAETFDLVACFATLHHVDLDAGLRRLRALTAPGGRLVVVGLAAVRSPLDAALSAAAVPAAMVADRRRGTWEHGSPVVDPQDGYGAVRAAARATLPGVRWRRRLYWRYSLEWTAPAGPASS